MDNLEERIDRLEAESEINRLLADYAHGIDRKELDRFMKIFHDDGEFAIPGMFEAAHGTKAIESLVREIWEGSPETHHWITNATNDFVGPDTATGDAHTICFLRTADGEEGVVCAYYDNSYERRDGAWRANSVAVHVQWMKKVEFGEISAG
jgi:uncharacterized protein (TIGR02246 family)